MEQVRYSRFAVFILWGPEQSVKWAYLDTDTAVHTQRIVNVESVEHVDCAGFATFPSRRGFDFVPFNVNTPIRA